MAERYAIAPGAPFPRRWIDKDGEPIRVMCEPVDGYLMARRLRDMPFVISVKEILNATGHRLGPFTVKE